MALPSELPHPQIHTLTSSSVVKDLPHHELKMVWLSKKKVWQKWVRQPPLTFCRVQDFIQCTPSLKCVTASECPSFHTMFLLYLYRAGYECTLTIFCQLQQHCLQVLIKNKKSDQVGQSVGQTNKHIGLID